MTETTSTGSSAKPMNVLTFLNSLRPALPMSIEQKCKVASNSEVRRWCNDKAVLINTEPVSWDEPVDFPVFSIVFFPNGKRRFCKINGRQLAAVVLAARC